VPNEADEGLTSDGPQASGDRLEHFIRRSGLGPKLPEVSAGVGATLGAISGVTLDRLLLDRLAIVPAAVVAVAAALLSFRLGRRWQASLQRREATRRESERFQVGPRPGESQRPDVFVGETPRRALALVLEAVERGERWLHLEGEPGLGKSTLVRQALDILGADCARSNGVDRRVYIDFDVVEASGAAASELLVERFGGDTHAEGLSAADRVSAVVVLDHCEQFLRSGVDDKAHQLVELLRWFLIGTEDMTVITIMQGRRLADIEERVGIEPVDIELDRMDLDDAVGLFHTYAPTTVEVALVRPIVEALGCLPRAVSVVARGVEAEVESTVGHRRPASVVARTYKRVVDTRRSIDETAPGSDKERNVSLAIAVQTSLSSPEVGVDTRALLVELAKLPDGVAVDEVAEIFDTEDAAFSGTYQLSIARRVGLVFASSTHLLVEPIVASHLRNSDLRRPLDLEPRWMDLALKRMGGADEQSGAWVRQNSRNLHCALRDRWERSAATALRLLRWWSAVMDEDLLVERAQENDLNRLVSFRASLSASGTDDEVLALLLDELVVAKRAELGHSIDATAVDEVLESAAHAGRPHQRFRLALQLLATGNGEELEAILHYHLGTVAFDHREFDVGRYSSWATAALDHLHEATRMTQHLAAPRCGSTHSKIGDLARCDATVTAGADPREVALAEYAQALRFYELADDNQGRGNVHLHLGEAALYKQWVELGADPREVALAEYAQALRFYELADDNQGRGNVHFYLGEAALYKQWVELGADPREVALAEYAQALRFYELADNNQGRGNVHLHLGRAALYKQWVEPGADSREVALAEYAQALRFYELADNNIISRGNVHFHLGRAAHDKQWVEPGADPREVALAEYAQALRFYVLADDNQGCGNVHFYLGEAAQYRQWVELGADPREVALAEYAQALRFYELADNNQGRGDVHFHLGRAALYRQWVEPGADSREVALAEYAQALRFYELADDNQGRGNVHLDLGRLRRADDHVEAWAAFLSALAAYRVAEVSLGMALAFDALAEAAHDFGLFERQWQHALQAEVDLRLAAHERYAEAGVPSTSPDFSRNMSALRTALRDLAHQLIWGDLTDGPPIDLREARRRLGQLLDILESDVDTEALCFRADVHYWLGLLACEYGTWDENSHANWRAAEVFHMRAAETTFLLEGVHNASALDDIRRHLRDCGPRSSGSDEAAS
jgi:hypothetical protein